jgi:hypothetical protein
VIFYRNVLALEIPNVSLLLGASIRPKDYGLYGCTLLCCKDLRSLLEFSLQYHNLVTKTVNMSLHVEDELEQSCIRFEDLLFASDLAEFNIELQCVIVLSLVRDSDLHALASSASMHFKNLTHVVVFLVLAVEPG